MNGEDEHPFLWYIGFIVATGLIMLLMNCDACSSSNKYYGMSEDDRIDDYN